jgi:hypothetical protein
MDLDWFWRDWIYTTARLDHAIADVRMSDDGMEIVIENRGDMEMPVELELSYTDGTTERVKLPVEMWNQGDRFVYRVGVDREISEVRLDPRGMYPDVDRGNDGMTVR